MYALSMRVLGALGAIRNDERRDTLGAFLTLFGFMTGHALLETARDALFLARLPASLLPWVYLTIAAVALALARQQPRLLSRFGARNELSAWLMFSGAVTVGFWALAYLAQNWVFYTLYAWSGVLATLVVVRFWTVLGNRFTVTQAKRLFAVIGSGSVLGAILGSGLARILTSVLAAQHVVLAAGLVFLLSAAGPTLLEGGGPAIATGRREQLDLNRVGRLIWGRPYLRRVAIVVLLSTITFTMVDFVFKSTAARFVADEAMGEFFSSVYLSLNLVSLVIQVVFVGWLIRRLGVNAAQAIVPVLLLAGGVGFVASGGLVAVLLFKGADGSTRYSLYRTATELLFVPMSAEIRGRVKAFIDVIGQRGGQALASLLILILLSLTTRETVFAALASVAAATWLVLVLDLRRHYLDVFRETLSDEITQTRIEFPALDVASLETLLATLNDSDDRKVMAALDLLAVQDKTRVIPALILYHPSPSVVIHALDLFVRSGRDDYWPIVDRLLDHASAGVRAAALRVRTVVEADEALLRRGTEDPAPSVRATALVGLIGGGWLSGAQAQQALNDLVSDGSSEAQLALAVTIRVLPGTEFESSLLRLLSSPDARVRAEAVRAVREIKSPSFVAPLIALLGDRAVRDDVRRTLVGLGPGTLPRLAAAMGDERLSHAVRRHLPQTIGAFGTPQAAQILLRRLLAEGDGMIRFKMLRALGRLRSENPSLVLDPKLIGQAVEQNLEAGFRFMRWRHALAAGVREDTDRRTSGYELLAGLLRDKQHHTLERLFRLLNLQASDEDFLRIYRGLHSLKREARAGSRELAENLVLPPLRRRFLVLLDDLFEAVGPSETNDREVQPLPYEVVLKELLASGTESLSSLAAHHIGELGLARLERFLRGIPVLSSHHRVVLEDVARRLVGGGAPERHYG